MQNNKVVRLSERICHGAWEILAAIMIVIGMVCLGLALYLFRHMVTDSQQIMFAMTLLAGLSLLVPASEIVIKLRRGEF